MTTFSQRAALRIPELSDGPPNINTAVGNAVNDVDKYIIPVYATPAARNTAEGTPTEGRHCYVTENAYDGRALQQYRGGAWVTLFAPPVFKYKSSTTSRLNTTTPTDDPELVCAMEANAIYMWEVQGFTSAQASIDLRIHMAYPSGCVIYWGTPGTGSTSWVQSAAEGSITGGQKLGDTSTFSGPLSIGTGSNAFYLPFSLRGIIIVGASSGNLKFQWAQQNISAVDAVAVSVGSSMFLQRVK